jgi:hypothetical protein
LERQAKARFSRDLLELDEADHIAILRPLSDEIDRQQREAQRGRFRTEAQGKAVYYVALTDKDPPARPGTAARVALETDPDLPVKFFRLIKNLTADGYYTSRAGLVEELGYTGNTVLAKFPGCPVLEH